MELGTGVVKGWASGEIVGRVHWPELHGEGPWPSAEGSMARSVSQVDWGQHGPVGNGDRRGSWRCCR